MAIHRIGAGVPITPASENAKTREKQGGKAATKDKVELSTEALQMFASAKAEKLTEIRERVKAGFYESREVTEKVVEGLLRDIRRPPTA